MGEPSVRRYDSNLAIQRSMSLQASIAGLQPGQETLELHASSRQLAAQSSRYVQGVDEVPILAGFETDATPQQLSKESRHVKIKAVTRSDNDSRWLLPERGHLAHLLGRAVRFFHHAHLDHVLNEPNLGGKKTGCRKRGAILA